LHKFCTVGSDKRTDSLNPKKLAADEPVSRILCAASRGALRRRGWRSRAFAKRTHRELKRRSAMIIPLGPGSFRDSSSLPEGQSSALLRTRCPFVRRGELRASIRAGPALPSYLALLHAGFSVPRVSPPGRWALTPPFHPCQMRSTDGGEPAVLPWACRRVRITPAVYFLWHFPWPRLRVPPSRNARRNPLALPGALPFRRRLLRGSDDRSPDFPPAGPFHLAMNLASRRSSNSPAKVIIARGRAADEEGSFAALRMIRAKNSPG